MADTTRPYHWGRENPNYTGPQRAQAASDAGVGPDPSGDFPSPETAHPALSDTAEKMAELVAPRIEYAQVTREGRDLHLVSVADNWIINDSEDLDEAVEDTVRDFRDLAELWHEAEEDDDMVQDPSEWALMELSDAVDDDEVLAEWLKKMIRENGPVEG